MTDLDRFYQDIRDSFFIAMANRDLKPTVRLAILDEVDDYFGNEYDETDAVFDPEYARILRERYP
jgi:hypothetical protein